MLHLNRKNKISFSGLDGSGKTTQIELLKNFLNKKKIEYEYIHLFSKKSSVVSKWHEKPLFSFLIKKIRGMNNSWIGVFIKISSRSLNVILDSWMTGVKDEFGKKSGIMIYDRYFYDVLAVLAFDFPKWERFILFLLKLIPKPSAIIIFKSDPKTVVGRKEEHSLEDAQRFCQIYEKMAKLLGVKMINSGDSIENIHLQIIGRLQAKL